MSLSALLAAALLLGGNGFFVAAEFALLAARRSRMEQLAAGGDGRAATAVASLRELSLMLAGAQLGITMMSLGLGAVAEPAVAAGLESLLRGAPLPAAARHAIAVVIALSIVVFLHMVVGEMAPKSWAISHPERSALALARPFRGFVVTLRPFIRLLNGASNAVVRACGVEPQNELAMVHTPRELLMLLEESRERGSLEAAHHDLLSRALDLSGLDAESAMVPRGDIVAVPAEAGVAELERIASTTGRSRLPVYEADLDRVRGVLHVKDLLGLADSERATVSAGDLARPCLIAPESRALEDLMLDMRQQRRHVAMVVNEFGTVTGLVTLEDLLEELIGEFEDESDRPRRRQRARRDGTVHVSGTLRPDELAQRTGVQLPQGEWETVAGFLMAELGRVPDVGATVDVDGARVRVVRMDGNRVVEVAVTPGPATDETHRPPGQTPEGR
jgi:CBS domain containing-hemolysin-like protein